MTASVAPEAFFRASQARESEAPEASNSRAGGGRSLFRSVTAQLEEGDEGLTGREEEEEEEEEEEDYLPTVEEMLAAGHGERDSSESE